MPGGHFLGGYWGDREKLLGGGYICNSKDGRTGWAEGTVAA